MNLEGISQLYGQYRIDTLAKLGPNDRVLINYRANGFPDAEIVRKTGLSLSTVKNRFSEHLSPLFDLSDGLRLGLFLLRMGMLADVGLTTRVSLNQFNNLSSAEKDVMGSLVSGFGNDRKGIARQLGRPENTVKNILGTIGDRVVDRSLIPQVSRVLLGVAYELHTNPGIILTNPNEYERRHAPTEEELLQSLVRGLTNKQIAAEYGVAVSTARNSLSLLFSKLGVQNRVEAAEHARSRGIN